MIQIHIDGLERLLKNTDPRILGKPLRNFFNRATITIQTKARKNAPVDTGRLRSSIGTRVDGGEVPKWGEVGTNVEYAPWMEFGTGLFAVGEGGAQPRHFPPGEGLEGWAARHGMASGYAVAGGIGKRGGLKPHLYLTKAFKDSLGEIQGLVGRIGSEIAAVWGQN